MYLFMYVCICMLYVMYVCMYVYNYVGCMYVIYVCTYVCNVCMYVYMYVRTYVQTSRIPYLYKFSVWRPFSLVIENLLSSFRQWIKLVVY